MNERKKGMRDTKKWMDRGWEVKMTKSELDTDNLKESKRKEKQYNNTKRVLIA